MNILIIADMEGISGICERNRSYIGCNTRDWELYGRKMITEEMQTIVKQCLDFGAESITICDAHNKGNSIIQEEFKSNRVNFISQIWNLKFKKIKYNYAILLGFHGMNGSGGILAHTFRPDIKSMKIDNYAIGEVGMILGLLSENKIPVILVTGDYHGVNEALKLSPQCIGCVVKSRHESGVNILSRDQSQSLLKKSVTKALENRISIPIVSFNYPLNISLKLVNNDYLDKLEEHQDMGYIIRSDKLVWQNTNFTKFFSYFSKLISKLNNEYMKILDKNREFVLKIRKMSSIVGKEKCHGNKELSLLLKKNILSLSNLDKERIMVLFEELLGEDNEKLDFNEKIFKF